MVFDCLICFVKEDVLLGLAFFQTGQPMERRQYLLSITNSRRRKDLTRAAYDYDNQGLSERYEKFNAIAKFEHMPYFKQGDELDPEGKTYVCRLVNAPHDQTHVVAAPYLKPIIYRLKQAWNVNNWIFYGSVSPTVLDQWASRVRNCSSFFMGDYTAFDATFTDYVWDMLESFYDQIYPDAPMDFWKVMAAWRKPQGSVRLRKEGIKLKYQAGTCNASGRDDTALANALFNGLALAISLASAMTGKTIERLNLADLIAVSHMVMVSVVGDDSLVCGENLERSSQKIVENLTRFGLEVKAQLAQRFDDVTYLGMMPYQTGGQYYWGPTLGRRLYKAYWQATPDGNLPAWTKGVAEQMSLFRHVPILSDMAVRVLDLLQGQKITKQSADENRMWHYRETATPSYDESTIVALCSRYEAVGVTLDGVRRDLERVKLINRLPCVLYSETLEKIIRVDDL